MIKKIQNEYELNQASDICLDNFGQYLSKADALDLLINSENSVIYKKDNNVVGVYILEPASILKYEEFLEPNFDKDYYRNKNGIEGILLAVKKSEQNLGIGKALINYAELLGYDYIFGAQYYELDNLSEWTKSGRRLVGDSGTYYLTLKDLIKKTSFSKHLTNLHKILYSLFIK